MTRRTYKPVACRDCTNPMTKGVCSACNEVFITALREFLGLEPITEMSCRRARMNTLARESS